MFAKHTLVSLLILICSVHPAVSASNLTEEQLRKIDSIDTPECVQKCDSNRSSDYEPPCPDSQDESTASMKRGYACLCTDKIFVESSISCYVKNCASNSTAFDIALSFQYAQCLVSADITYPEPKAFLNDLCLLTASASAAPTDLALLKNVFPDYTYATDFPAPTETISLGNSAPTWTCTPTPLSGKTTATDNSTTNTGDNTGVTHNTTTIQKGGATVIEQNMMVGMAAVVAAVAGLAVFL